MGIGLSATVTCLPTHIPNPVQKRLRNWHWTKLRKTKLEIDHLDFKVFVTEISKLILINERM